MRTAIFAILLLVLCKATPAQTQSAEQAKKVFTLEQAVDFALKNYPAVRASLERIQAAEASVGLARTNYLPRADVLWQTNRATDNNITGLLLPQSIIAPISGPVPISPSNQSALVGPSTGASSAAMPMLRLEKADRLRLVVPVPGKYAGGIAEGTKIGFSVPAYPGQSFTGTIARIAHSVHVKTRTMPVELDVNNADRRLSSGMFPEVTWAVRRTGPSMFVPVSAVVRTTEATFVVRIRNGNSEWVNVQAGELDGKSIEVIGGLRDGDEIAARGTDELRPGTHVVTKQIPAETQTRM